MERASKEPASVDATSLLQLRFKRLERVWHAEAGQRGAPREEDTKLATAPYRPKHYLRRRFPDEIEAVLATLDQGALDIIRSSVEGQALNLLDFVEAVVHTGNYDADRVLAFVGGVVDLFLETLRSQAFRAEEGADVRTVNWPQLMNHFIECPEIAMFEGSEGGGAGMQAKSANSGDRVAQVHRNAYVDRAKHLGTMVQKVSYCPYLDNIITVEGSESISFWTPHVPGWDAPRAVTPQLGSDFRDIEGNPLYTVMACAWDDELQDLVGLLSNRMLIVWRLRNRDKGQFQQKRELRFHACRHVGRVGEKYWQVHLLTVDPKTGLDVNDKSAAHEDRDISEKAEFAMRKVNQEHRDAEEASVQLDIWWSVEMKVWITAHKDGRLFLWDLRSMDANPEPFFEPKKVLKGHKRLVTSFLELNKYKFSTTSVDHSIIIWDIKNLTLEVRIEGHGCHEGAVLSQTYVPRYNVLVTAGTEKRVFVWTVDGTAFRGNKAKLTGHNANVSKVTGGQRVFFSMDELYQGILWDASTLTPLQMVNLELMVPRHCLCMPDHGMICIAGRRLNFLEGNDLAAAMMGKALSKEQQVKVTGKQDDKQTQLNKSPPVWCGMSDARGALLSATEMEVRLHSRASPGDSKAIFLTPDNDAISAYSVADDLSWAVIGTSKGAIHFIKERSGFPLTMYPGRSAEIEETRRKPGAGPGGDGAEGGDAAAKPASSHKLKRQGSKGDHSAGAAAGGDGIPADGGLDSASPPGRKKKAGEQSTCPTPEEVQRGVSGSITCVLPHQAKERVYAGTVEGRVLVFHASEEAGFPIVRWLCPSADAVPVTCLNCGDKAGGKLLAVGMQDGTVYLYMVSNMRLAGTIPIPQLLPGGDSLSKGTDLRHLRLFSIRAEAGLPITLMTVDAGSRLRLWGLDVHDHSGKVSSLKLIVDGGQLQESDGVPVKTKSLVPEAILNVPMEHLKQREASPTLVDVCAVATMTGTVSLPVNALMKQTADGPAPSSDKKVLSAAKAAKKGHDADPKRMAAEAEAAALARSMKASRKAARRGSNAMGLLSPTSGSGSGSGSVFLTGVQPPPSREGWPTSPSEQAVEEFSDCSGSDTDADADEVVGWRLDQQPREPKKDAGIQAAEPDPVLVDGAGIVWFADSGGWIWCIDVRTSVTEAVEKSPPVAVVTADARPKQRKATQTRRESALAVSSTSLGQTIGGRASSKTAQVVAPKEDAFDLVLAKSVSARPGSFKVINAWPAHQSAIASLAPSGSPAALVSADLNKEVKVWSTTGDLWGQFSLKGGLEGVGAPVAVWPPPHVLSAQLSLMRSAKQLCKRMGMQFHKLPEVEKLPAESGRDWSSRRKGTAPLHTPPASIPILEDALLVAPEPQAAAEEPQAAELEAAPEIEAAPEAAAEEAPPAEEAPDAAEGEGEAPDAAEGEGEAAAADGEAPAADEEAAPDAEAEEVVIAEDREPSVRPESADSRASRAATPMAQLGGAKKEKKPYDAKQFREMIRNNAFSSGYHNYNQFIRKVEPGRAEQKWKKTQGEPRSSFEGKRGTFFNRPPSAFGVELLTDKEGSHWEAGKRGMGARSSSEGALLRYAQCAVEDMTRSVKDNLGIDVKEVSRSQIRTPSFTARLDIGGVSQNPTDPSSATAKAVRKLYTAEGGATSLPALNGRKGGRGSKAPPA